MKIYLNISIVVALSITICAATISCKKMVVVDPPVSATTDESVYREDATAIGVLTGIYSRISSNSFNMISKKAGLSADEFDLWNGAGQLDNAYYTNALRSVIQSGSSSSFSAGHELWNDCYWYIATCNSAIEGLNASASLTPFVKQQLLGEAKFMRAFLYFYLVNLYGDVPLVTTSDYQKNRFLTRSPQRSVYELIISDLKESKSLLSENYLDGRLTTYSGTTQRVRPTTWAASALLSRVYLFTGDFINCEAEANKVISNTSIFNLAALSDAFLANENSEAIWQLQPVNLDYGLFLNTEDGRYFNLSVEPLGFSEDKSTYLSSSLLSMFEQGDQRKAEWTSTYIEGSDTFFFPYKYKIGIGTSSIEEYLSVLRLGELYLVRAEARAQQDHIADAKNDLNAIRQRAGLPHTTAIDKASLLSAIMQERQIELFTEWGHRWLDLKRTKSIDAVMSVVTPIKANGSAWKSYQQLYPLPLDDIQRDPNLNQNFGY